MRKQLSYLVAWLLVTLAVFFADTALGATDAAEQESADATSPRAGSRPADNEGSVDQRVNLLFRLKLDRKVYIQSDWGQPPQLAIWLEQPDGHEIKTLWVTHRTGAGQWAGKADCPVSLPYWVSRYNKETKTTGPPTFRRPVADAITQPTPKNEFRSAVDVPRGSTWDCFIEVNVSGDFNRDFPSMRDDGVEDQQGNGQPSLIYRGRIVAEVDARSSPKLVGRTDQFDPVDHIIRDLKGMTSAKQLLSAIAVSCIPVASVGTTSSISRNSASKGDDEKAEDRKGSRP